MTVYILVSQHWEPHVEVTAFKKCWLLKKKKIYFQLTPSQGRLHQFQTVLTDASFVKMKALWIFNVSLYTDFHFSVFPILLLYFAAVLPNTNQAISSASRLPLRDMTHPSRDFTCIPSTMPMALCWGKRNLHLGNMTCLGQHWHTPQLGQSSLSDPNAWSTAKCNSDCCQVAASDNYHRTSILALMALLIVFPFNQYQVCNSRAGQI